MAGFMKSSAFAGRAIRGARAVAAACIVWGALGLGGTATVARADTASDLARVALEAAGGAKAHAALESFRAMGVTRVGEKEVSFILFAARPNRIRVETLGERGTLVRGFDGKHAPWRIPAGAAAKPERLARIEERVFVREADFDQPFFNYAERGWSLDFGGEIMAPDGKKFVRLLATSRRAETEWWYLDADTLLLVRRDKENGQVRTFYSGHRAVAGVMLPTRIRVESGGRVLNETTITDYTDNPPLPADFFAPPAADWPKW